MIEQELVVYGPLGLWTGCNLALIWYLIKRGEKKEERLNELIENNTVALAKVHEVLTKCQKK